MRISNLSCSLFACLFAQASAFQLNPIGNSIVVASHDHRVPTAATAAFRKTLLSDPTCSRSSLIVGSSASDLNDGDDGPSWEFNPFFAGALAVLLGFTLFLAPGEFSGENDMSMLQAIIANPTSPEGINQVYMVIFNALGILPILMTSMILPQGSKRGLPVAPFASISFAAGFFGIAPYLIFRDTPVESKTLSEMSWFGRNVTENKIFNWLQVGLLLALPFATGVVANADQLPDMAAGYQSLLASSKFVSVSTLDLITLTLCGAALIPKDYALRTDGDIEQQGNKIALATLLFPAVGLATYCALRPSLPEE